MYLGTDLDTLKFAGTDLQDIPGIIVGDLAGLLAPGTRKGDNVPIPNGPTLGVPKVYDAYEFAIPITVLAFDETGVMPATRALRRAQMLQNLASVGAALVGTGGLGLLERVLTGASGLVTEQANGEFVDGLQLEMLNFHTGQTELQFINLDGAWFDAGDLLTPLVP